MPARPCRPSDDDDDDDGGGNNGDDEDIELRAPATPDTCAL